MKKDYWLYGLAVVTGVLVWVIVSNASGRREAWDSQWYFLISVPVVCVISAALGFVEPRRPWRWGGRSSYWSVFLDAVHPRAG